MSDTTKKLEKEIQHAIKDRPLAPSELATKLGVNADKVRSTVVTLVDKGDLKVTPDWKVSK